MHLPYVLLEFLLGGLGERRGLVCGLGMEALDQPWDAWFIECGNLSTYVW